MDIIATRKISPLFVRTELVAKSQKDEKSISDIFTVKVKFLQIEKILNLNFFHEK